MMSHLIRWMLILSGLFLLPVLLIRAQPYDDGELRAFLTPPDGCPAPCFMGIRPGVTTVEAASKILEGHVWVSQVKYSNYFEATDAQGHRSDHQIIEWYWSNQQPDWINPDREATLWLTNDLATRMDILFDVSLGELLLSMGPPDQHSIFSTAQTSFFGWTYRGKYLDRGIEVNIMSICPIPHRDLFLDQIWLHFQNIESAPAESIALPAVCKA